MLDKKNTALRSSFVQKDVPFDSSLRPKSLSDFLGQQALKERLAIVIQAAKERNEALGHCLFHGPPGLGKTTLANIIAQMMQKRLVSLAAPAIDKATDLAGILTSLEEGDVLFIDEIHRLNRSVEEYLYSAMEDFFLDLVIDSGPSSRTVQVPLKRFTLIGATTKTGMISSPLRSRFTFTFRLDYYSDALLAEILLRSARMLSLELSKEAALELAMRSRGTPRIANHLLRWVRDFAQIRQKTTVDLTLIKEALSVLAGDQKGLDELDHKLLTLLIDHHGGGPVGIDTLAAALCEDSHTLAEVCEPYLIKEGFLRRTPRGREATELAYLHLGKTQKNRKS